MATKKPYQFVEEGARLKAFRKNTLHITAAEMAEQIGISTKYMSMLETGERQASARILKAISQRYGIPADTITSGKQYGSAIKVRSGDTLTLEVKVARLEARVDQLEMLLSSFLSAKQS